MEKKLELRLILDAVDKLTRPLRAANREAAAANQVLQQTKAKVKDLEAAQRDIASFKGMTTQLGQTSGALQAAKIKADDLARAHAAAENPTKKMTAAMARAEKQVERLQAEEVSRTAQLDRMRSKLDAAGISTKNLATHEARLKAEIADGNFQIALQTDRLHKAARAQARLKAARAQYDKTQAFAGSMQGAGMSAVGAGMVTAAPLIAAGGLAVNFEDAMLDVKKVVDFETPQQFAQMSDDILTLTTRIPIAAEGFAAIVAAAGQAKIPRAELIGFAEDAGKMGVAFDSTADEAGKMMATWRTAFALTQPQVRSLADQINYLGDNGNATALQISNVVTRVGPLGKVAGLAAAQVAALGSTMVGMGVGEEIAATGIKNTMLALTKGEAATKSQQKAFAALGLEATAVAKAMQADAGGAIMDVLTKIKGLDAHRQAAVLTQLFGSESVQAISPMLNNLDALQESLDAVGDASRYAGSMDKEFQNRMTGTKTAIETAKNSVKALGVEFGSAFLPQIKAVSDTINKISISFRDFAQAHPNVVKAVGTVVGVVAAALLAFGALAMIIAAVLGPFALMRLAFVMTTPMFAPLIAGASGAASAFAAWGAAMLANPITWIVLAIVAAVALLAGAAYLIYKNWGAISAFFSGLWAQVSAGAAEMWTTLTTGFSDLWSKVSDAVSAGLTRVLDLIFKWTPLGAVIRNWSAITDFFGAFWETISQVVGLGLDLVKLALLRFTPLGLIMRNWEPITGFLSGLWAALKDLIARGFEGLKFLFFNFTPLGLIIRNWEPIMGFVGGLWSRLKDGVSAGLDMIKTAIANFKPLNDFKAAFAEVWTWMKELPGKLLSAGADAMRGFTQGIRGQKGHVQAAAAEVAGRAETGARRRLDTHSPSRVFAAIGDDVMAGLSLGISQGARGPLERMRQAAAALTAAGAVTASAGIVFSESPALESTGFEASPRFDASPRFTPAAGSSETGGRPIARSSQPVTVHNEFHIHATPGMDLEALARLVAEKMAEAQRQTNLAALNDTDESWS